MSGTPRQAFVGAGANLGDREKTLQSAAERLRRTAGIRYVESSSLYETDPVGGVDQPAFLNVVVGIETELTPESLLRELLAIELEFGRVRTVRWGPRTLDLDLLAFEGEVRDTATLTLPHPRLFERDFVKVPLRELLGRKRLAGAMWNDLRTRLGPAVDDTPGVRRWKS